MAEHHLDQASKTTENFTEARKKTVIGIYGIPGCGKTYLLAQLKRQLQDNSFEFLEGSQLIDTVVPGGLGAFQAFEEHEKVRWRELAIKSVAREDTAKERIVVIAGHYMFWKENERKGTPVATSGGLETYTHILYLDVPAEIVWRRRQQDTLRDRPEESVSHLRTWQQTEKSDLRRLCYDHGILFSVISEEPNLVERVSERLKHFEHYTEDRNRSIARAELDKIFEANNHQWKTLAVIDADKTLAAVDTGDMFWNKVVEMWPSKMRKNPLREIFASNMQYTYTAFVQAMLLCEETLELSEFNDACTAVALAIDMYPEFVSLLQAIAEQAQTGAVIITSGLRQVWEEVLKREGLSSRVKVIGGGRLENCFVVTGHTKADLVSHAKHVHNTYTYAFGDSPLDLGMLKEADRAIVVVGKEELRSKSMEEALLSAIENDGLRAHQVVLPYTASPRLSLNKLPGIQLTDFEFVREILRLHPRYKTFEVTHATSKNAAKLLMTPMRDARVAGPALREAHRRVGHYLATEYLSEMSSVEEHPIPHVQGHQVPGYRILHEQKTLIVPLMRGGESMAFGINDVLPSAMFLHASRVGEISREHVHGRLSVILVDSVVNSGRSLLEFVQYVRRIHATVRIVAIAGVVQSGALSRLDQEACCHLNFRLVALRLSDNKYTGRGGTDTGNRLFNTTHLT